MEKLTDVEKIEVYEAAIDEVLGLIQTYAKKEGWTPLLDDIWAALKMARNPVEVKGTDYDLPTEP